MPCHGNPQPERLFWGRKKSLQLTTMFLFPMLKLLGASKFRSAEWCIFMNKHIRSPALNIAPLWNPKRWFLVYVSACVCWSWPTRPTNAWPRCGTRWRFRGLVEGLHGFFRDIAYVYIYIFIYTMNYICRDWCILFTYYRIFCLFLFRWLMIVSCEKWYKFFFDMGKIY